MAEKKKLKLLGFVVHDGQIKKEGDFIDLEEAPAERLVKLNKAEYVKVVEEDGKRIDEMTHAELDQLVEQLENDYDLEDYPKSGKREEKIDFLEEKLQDKAE